MINLKGNNIASVHQENRSKILQAFFLHAPISRIEIAKLTSLTPPTITSCVNTLMSTGLIKEYEQPRAKNNPVLGRKRILLDIVKDAGYAIGVDWGPNGIICSATDLRGNVIDIEKSANKKWEIESTVDKTSEMIKQLIKKNRLSRKKIIGIGVGIPGFVEIESGLVCFSSAYGWIDAPIGKMLESATGLPVCIENDVRVMAIKEMLFSSWETRATGMTGNFLYVYVGEGIACAVVHNNELFRGNNFGAGEIGHTIVSWDGPKCRCGKKGCLEAVASEIAIKKQAAKVLSVNSSPKKASIILKKEINNPNLPTIGEILSAYDKENKTVISILDQGIKYLGASIANVIGLINPRLVLIDGQIFSRPALSSKLLKTVKEHTLAFSNKEIEFEFKKYDINRCSLGSAACAIRYFLIK